MRCMLLALGLLIVVGCSGQGWPPPPTLQPVGTIVTRAQPTAEPRAGESEVKLGTRPVDFGSLGQAREMLALMDQHPGKMAYTITYFTAVDHIVFSCDFAANIVMRIHSEAIGRGKTEIWDGNIMERIRSAAGGGSLNDTPAGKRFARESSF